MRRRPIAAPVTLNRLIEGSRITEREPKTRRDVHRREAYSPGRSFELRSDEEELPSVRRPRWKVLGPGDDVFFARRRK